MWTLRMSHRVANSFKIWKGKYNAYAQRSYGADGMGGQNPPSVIRTAWYMWLVDPIRQREPYTTVTGVCREHWNTTDPELNPDTTDPELNPDRVLHINRSVNRTVPKRQQIRTQS
jgi:hypothetical protein